LSSGRFKWCSPQPTRACADSKGTKGTPNAGEPTVGIAFEQPTQLMLNERIGAILKRQKLERIEYGEPNGIPS